MLSSSLCCRLSRVASTSLPRSCGFQASLVSRGNRRRRFSTAEAPPLENFEPAAVPTPIIPRRPRPTTPAAGINATNDRLQSLFETNKMSEAEYLWTQMQQVGPRPDARTFGIVIKFYCRTGRVPIAERLLQKMKRERDPAPTSVHYGLLITHWALIGNFREIELLINDMMEYGLKPTPHIWSSSLVAYVRSELSLSERPKTPEELVPVLEKAKEIFHQLLKQKALYANAYEVMIELLSKMERYAEAIQLFRDLTHAGLKPSKHTINNYIYCLGSSGDWKAAMAMAENLPSYSRAHDKLILAAAQLGDHRRVEHLVSAFASADVAETSRYRLSFETTEAIIRMHLKAGDFDKAEQFYQSTLPYVSKFSADMYNMLIQEYMKYNDLLRAEDTFEEMKAHSVLPTLESAATVIRLYGRLGRTAKAQRIFAETVARGFKPDTNCYNALLEALLFGEKVPEARATYEELKSSGLEPNPETIRVLIRLLGREGDPDTAHQVFEDMQLKHGFEKTVQHFNELLAAYAYNDRPDAVESVLFSGQGIAADEATYVTLLDMLIKRDQYDRAARIFEFLRSRHTDNGDESFSFEKSPALINMFIRMLTRCGDFVMAEYSFNNDALKPLTATSAVSSSGMTNVVADVDTYAAMIECYASQNRLDETLAMLESMKNAIKTRRRVPDCYSLALVVDLLGRSGRIADAVAVWNDLTLNYRIIPDSMAYAVILETCARNGAIAHAVPLAECAINAASSGDMILMTDFAEACKLLAQPRISAKFQHRDEMMKPLRLRNSRGPSHVDSSDEVEAVVPISSQVVEGLRQLVQSLKKLPRKNS
eukprot:TRINITY_DN5087_c0_g1_i1.p1 TRINITY_DN5087_c0_g1~~TRINITY_DN5087_c0_g1_i1.p1  ORF type:complete len:824 (-),score=105.19 TRINITY_DN5087_c0_g1_i1:1109-3580(-)